jgi:hypothetical protein
MTTPMGKRLIFWKELLDKRWHNCCKKKINSEFPCIIAARHQTSKNIDNFPSHPKRERGRV